jgi:hypothetical protein
MALKLRFNTVEEIPAEHRAFYVHQNGVWVLDVEGGLDTGVEPFGKNPFKRGPALEHHGAVQDYEARSGPGQAS